MLLSTMSRRTKAIIGASSEHEMRLTLEAAGIPTYAHCHNHAEAELRRSHRYGHPLSMLVLGLDPGGLHRVAQMSSGEEGPEAWYLRRFEYTGLQILAWVLRDGTRESDVLSFAEDHHAFMALLPETDGPSAQATAKRLGEIFGRRTSLTLKTGLAIFPDDGLMIDDLFEAARGVWRLRRRPRPEVRDAFASLDRSHSRTRRISNG